MCKSLETANEVTDDQEKMSYFFHNKLVTSRWLDMHRHHPVYAQ